LINHWDATNGPLGTVLNRLEMRGHDRPALERLLLMLMLLLLELELLRRVLNGAQIDCLDG